MGTHHPYGPSNYPAWATGCKLFRSNHSESKEATEGTKIHEEVSEWIKSGKEPDSDTARWMVDRLSKMKEQYGATAILSEVRVERIICGMEMFGTVDAFFYDKDNILHIIDFKSFSDGTTDYMAQLKGYATLMITPSTVHDKCQLHIFHGGSFTVEDSTVMELVECEFDTVELLVNMRDEMHEPTVCKWCQYCSHVKECKAANHAIAIVNENGVMFNHLSTCQKLVVLDAVDKLSKTIREQAKKECEENGGVLEQDGIRYEFKEKAGKGSFNDITELASCVCQKTIIATINDSPIKMSGISHEELLGICEITKTKLTEIIRSKNPKDSGVKKKDIEELINKFYTKGEPTKQFIRTK